MTICSDTRDRLCYVCCEYRSPRRCSWQLQYHPIEPFAFVGQEIVAIQCTTIQNKICLIYNSAFQLLSCLFDLPVKISKDFYIHQLFTVKLLKVFNFRECNIIRMYLPSLSFFQIFLYTPLCFSSNSWPFKTSFYH